MTEDFGVHRRRSSRLANWDYASEGAYFVTLCTSSHESSLGVIHDAVFFPSGIGRIVEDEWKKTFLMRPNLAGDCFVIMPNHFHAIVFIADKIPATSVGANCVRPNGGESHDDRNAARQYGPSRASLASTIAGFKSAVTSRSRKLLNDPALQVWQRNYYEHIIRNEVELQKCREYIVNNPLKWELDRFYRESAACGLKGERS